MWIVPTKLPTAIACYTAVWVGRCDISLIWMAVATIVATGAIWSRRCTAAPSPKTAAIPIHARDGQAHRDVRTPLSDRQLQKFRRRFDRRGNRPRRTVLKLAGQQRADLSARRPNGLVAVHESACGPKRTLARMLAMSALGQKQTSFRRTSPPYGCTQ